MVAIGISEFSFGFAFLHEQVMIYHNTLCAAPILPNLFREWECGWDARLPSVGTDFYYQFKISEYLSRSNARFIRDGTYEGPYYRISLHRAGMNRQHQRLKELSRDNPHTFYVAPEFNNLNQFNSAFLTQSISSQSRLFPLAECGEIHDSKQHYITYQDNSEEWILHSEKKVYTKSFFGKNLSALYLETKKMWKPIDKEYINQLFYKTIKNAERIMDSEKWIDYTKPDFFNFDPETSTSDQTLMKISQLLSIFYGATLILIGGKKPVQPGLFQ